MIRILEGQDIITPRCWLKIKKIITEKQWDRAEPALPSDKEDPLLSKTIAYGTFMLGFDFHIKDDEPYLIEINTNAGGFYTLPKLYPERRKEIEDKIRAGFEREVVKSGRGSIGFMAIVDENIAEQPLYNEMKWVAEIMRDFCAVKLIKPEDLTKNEKGLYSQDQKIDLIYNRLTDFRLAEKQNALIRKAAQEEQIILTPHPAKYVRIADKRLFLKSELPWIPKTYFLSEKKMEDWLAQKNAWVFKPSDKSGSRGVYRGDKVSASKLKSLPADTLVQEYISPMKSENGSKYDIRVYSIESEILGVVGRHYSGQVMEMRSELSGFRAVRVGSI